MMTNTEIGVHVLEFIDAIETRNLEAQGDKACLFTWAIDHGEIANPEVAARIDAANSTEDDAAAIAHLRAALELLGTK